MTHKEKAKELINLFLPLADYVPGKDAEASQRQNAWACAMVCVDEILKSLEGTEGIAVKFYRLVKKELDKM